MTNTACRWKYQSAPAINIANEARVKVCGQSSLEDFLPDDRAIE